MTLVATCKIASIDPVHYLTDILMRSAYAYSGRYIEELHPQNWRS